MTTDNQAPGQPGIPPTWSSSNKDLVITGLGSSQIWATLGHGILNEVYWPSTGQPQIRDLGFIVAKDGQWWELKRLDRYRLSMPRPYVLLPTVRHEGDEFAVTLELACDDLRDVVLVRYKLEGDGYRLFTILAPRLGSKGHDNTAWCERGAFFATGDGGALCLQSSVGFDRQSVGYVGTSDGWQDFQQHNDMTWSYQCAEAGNVAATGGLSAPQGVLALGFCDSQRGAETLARTSLADGFDSIVGRVTQRWEAWAENLTLSRKLEKRFRAPVDHSAAVLKTCDDRLFTGAVVASLSVPWGDSRDDLGGYHLVWSRDAVASAFAMIAMGHFAEARQSMAYLLATQQEDGHWAQSLFPDGRPYYTGIQLDETSFPLLLAAKLRELKELGHLEGIDRLVDRAAAFLVHAGPVTPQDRWEENEGISPFTLSLIVAALVGAAELVHDDAERDYVLSYADYLNRRIEDWVYVEGSELARKYEVDGHYIRLATPRVFSGDHGELPIANGGGTLPAAAVVALDYLYLARLGLRRANDSRMQNTLRVVEGELRVDTPSGPAFHRYNGDGYGEHDDGWPFDGTGRGRLWPLLTGERGHLAVQLREDPAAYLEAMRNMTGPGGLLPEQVWDAAPIPDRGLYPGKPTGSAMPLLWAHAELIKLAKAIATKVPVELLDAVKERYHFQRPEPSTWHWRNTAPFHSLPTGTDLLVEAAEPFQLHIGFDGWQNAQDRPSHPLALGMHGVRLASDELKSWQEVNLTVYFDEQGAWEGVDHRIAIGLERAEQQGGQPAHAMA